MKKLKRNDLSKIMGAIEYPPKCAIDWSCPPGLCCTADYTCRDFRKYACI